jgi:hypothetical protein
MKPYEPIRASWSILVLVSIGGAAVRKMDDTGRKLDHFIREIPTGIHFTTVWWHQQSPIESFLRL